MKTSTALTLAASLALAASGAAFAQGSGAAGSGTAAGASASAGGSSSASGGVSAGTTGAVVGPRSGSATTTATGIAPADGSNDLPLPEHYSSMPSSPDAAAMGHQMVNGAVLAQAGSYTAADGNSKVTITRYWVNVPAGAEQHAGFHRWQQLR